MKTISKFHFLFCLITKLSSTATLEDSSHKSDYYKRVQSKVEVLYQISYWKFQCKDSILHYIFTMTLLKELLGQFSFTGSSYLPNHIYHLKKKKKSHKQTRKNPNQTNKPKKTTQTTKTATTKQHPNNYTNTGQDVFHIIHLAFSLFSTSLTFRSIGKISWPGFFWSCTHCIDKSTYVYSYELMNTQIWQIYI